MIDTETLGTGPNSVVLEIAAVQFDLSGRTGERWSKRINVQHSQDLGMEIEIDTVAWWINNHHEVFLDLVNNCGHLDPKWVMNDLRQFINSIRPEGKFFVWSYYPAFDMCKLNNYFKKTNTIKPWAHNEEFDFATVVMGPLGPEEIPWPSEAKHTAEADCNLQIQVLCEVLSGIDSGLL